MKLLYPNGLTSVILRVKIRDATSILDAGLTGLTSASAGLIISTICDNEAIPTVYTQVAGNIEGITTLGTFETPTASKCRFKLVDNTNHPGTYEIHLANARFAVPSARSLQITITGPAALNLCQEDYEVQLFVDKTGYTLSPSGLDAVSAPADLANDAAARGSFVGMIRALFNRFYDETTQTTSQQKVKNDAGVVVSTMPVSDDTVTQVKGKSV